MATTGSVSGQRGRLTLALASKRRKRGNGDLCRHSPSSQRQGPEAAVKLDRLEYQKNSGHAELYAFARLGLTKMKTAVQDLKLGPQEMVYALQSVSLSSRLQCIMLCLQLGLVGQPLRHGLSWYFEVSLQRTKAPPEVSAHQRDNEMQNESIVERSTSAMNCPIE